MGQNKVGVRDFAVPSGGFRRTDCPKSRDEKNRDSQKSLPVKGLAKCIARRGGVCDECDEFLFMPARRLL
jgi:hypothetical protein